MMRRQAKIFKKSCSGRTFTEAAGTDPAQRGAARQQRAGMADNPQLLEVPPGAAEKYSLNLIWVVPA